MSPILPSNHPASAAANPMPCNRAGTPSCRPRPSLHPYLHCWRRPPLHAALHEEQASKHTHRDRLDRLLLLSASSSSAPRTFLACLRVLYERGRVQSMVNQSGPRAPPYVPNASQIDAPHPPPPPSPQAARPPRASSPRPPWLGLAPVRAVWVVGVVVE